MDNEDINGILNTLYEVRSRGFESKYIRSKEKQEAGELEKKLKSLVKKDIKDKKIQNRIFEIFNNFEECYLAEMILWNREYYKLGFLDGTRLKKELEEMKEIF